MNYHPNQQEYGSQSRGKNEKKGNMCMHFKVLADHELLVNVDLFFVKHCNIIQVSGFCLEL